MELKNNLEKLYDLIKKENISSFFPYLILTLGKKIENTIKYDFPELSEDEKKDINTIWKLDFYSNINFTEYYKLITKLSDSIKDYPKQLLGHLSDTILKFPNERINLKSLLISIMIFSYIKNSDLNTAQLLFKNLKPFSNIKPWKALYLIIKIHICKDANIKIDVLKKLFNIYSIRKSEINALNYNLDYFYFEEFKVYLKQKLPLKAVYSLKKIKNFSNLEDYKKKLFLILNSCKELEKNKHFEACETIFNFLINSDFPKNEKVNILFKIANKYLKYSKKESNPIKSEEFLKKAKQLFNKIAKEYPNSSEFKKLPNLYKNHMETIKSDNKNVKIKKYIWIFFITSWIFLLLSFFISFSFSFGTFIFIFIYLILLFVFKYYLEKTLL